MEKTGLLHWGNIEYQTAWDRQTELMNSLVDIKRGKSENTNGLAGHLVLCGHPPVFTLGKAGSESNLLIGKDQLQLEGIEYFPINRGGDITYHGPGQIVGYPILDLDKFFTDVHRYVRSLEEVIIRSLREFDLEGSRHPEYTGVWIADDEGVSRRKICAIGVHLSRWVSMHGFALNVNTNLTHYNHIIPCGIADPDKGVTSMHEELGREIDESTVEKALKNYFCKVFETELVSL